MPTPPDSDPAATLAGIRENNERVITLCDMAPAVVRQLAEHDVPRLLAALEAATKLAGEWSVESAALEGGHRGLADHGADKLRTAMYSRSVALADCADQLREAITTALTGKEAGDG